MEFIDCQACIQPINATLKKSEILPSYDDVIHYLGLIGEVGSVISELMKKIRDG